MKLIHTIVAAAALLCGPLAAWGQVAPAASPTPAAVSPMPAASTVISGTIGATSSPFFLGTQATTTAPAAQSTGGMLQLTIYLVLIAAMLIGGIYLTRGGFSNLVQRGKGEKKLLISESRTLGNRQFLVVAEYEGRKMLLGVCPGRIDYLSTLASGGSDETFSADLEDKE